VSGKQQVVSGMNYRLIIETANGPTSNSMYDAVVYEQSSTKKRKLMSFTQARN
jgi:mannose/fructose-specific phosphotransferase system component IIA